MNRLQPKVKVGEKYGHLIVMEILAPDRTKSCQSRRALCTCDCGGTNIVRLDRLYNGEISSCGCMRGYKPRKGNKITVKDTYAEMIAGNYTILIDIEDIEKLKIFTWSVNSGKTIEAHTRMDSDIIAMHRFLMGFPSCIVDHKNRNTLDNRRSNLRLATHAQNMQNQVTSTGTSQYKGVTKSGHKWRAQIQRKYLGEFTLEIEAALAYDSMARILYGEFARLNFEETI